MPKLLNAAEEFKKLQAVKRTDSSHRWQVVAKVDTPIYQRILETAQEDQKPISHIAERYLVLGVESQTSGGDLQLDATESTLLRALTTAWACSTEVALKRLLRLCAVEALTKEEAEAQKAHAALQKFSKTS